MISDPVRPKLDKGTILTESILAVNELRSDIAGMKSEHIALSDESRDVSFYSSTHCYWVVWMFLFYYESSDAVDIYNNYLRIS